MSNLHQKSTEYSLIRFAGTSDWRSKCFYSPRRTQNGKPEEVNARVECRAFKNNRFVVMTHSVLVGSWVKIFLPDLFFWSGMSDRRVALLSLSTADAPLPPVAVANTDRRTNPRRLNRLHCMEMLEIIVSSTHSNVCLFRLYILSPRAVLGQGQVTLH